VCVRACCQVLEELTLDAELNILQAYDRAVGRSKQRSPADVGKSVELESLAQLASVLTTIVTGPFTVCKLCYFQTFRCVFQPSSIPGLATLWT